MRIKLITLALLLIGCSARSSAQMSNQTYRTLTLVRDAAQPTLHSFRIRTLNLATRVESGINTGLSNSGYLTLSSDNSNITMLSVSEAADDYLEVVDGGLRPDSDGTRKLGHSGRSWGEVWTNELHGITELALNELTINLSPSGSVVLGDGSIAGYMSVNGGLEPVGALANLGHSSAAWNEGWFGQLHSSTFITATSGSGAYVEAVSILGGSARLSTAGGNGALMTNGTKVVGPQQSGISGTANGTYDSTEQNMLNSICEALAAHGLIASCH